jgi:hypothetical protein
MPLPGYCSLPALSWGWGYDETSSESQPNDFTGDCAVWRWCPCDGESMGYCSRESVGGSYPCPMSEIVNFSCSGGDAGWELVCGDKDLGPPCMEGQYFGQVKIICRCPEVNYSSDSSSSLSLSLSYGYWYSAGPICGSLPGPAAFGDIKLRNINLGEAIPALMFGGEYGPGALSAWTWCCCEDSECSYPSLSSSCPFDAPGCGAFSGPGQWVHRGGPVNLGPPPVVGTFYGETVFIGYCCPESSDSSSMASSVWNAMLLSYTAFCSLPQFPLYDVPVVTNAMQDTHGGTGFVQDNNIVNASACSIDDTCSGWVWCPCECSSVDMDYEKYDPTECPWTPESPATGPGGWQLFSGEDHHGPPPIVGRFFGEIEYFCPCLPASSESSSSSSEWCVMGGAIVGGAIAPAEAKGNYAPVGWNDHQPYYRHVDNTDWYLWFYDDSNQGVWVITNAPPGAAQTVTWIRDLALHHEWEGAGGTYTAGVGATGDAEVIWCSKADTDCDLCPADLKVNISGMTGDCADLNDSGSGWFIYKEGGGDDCYYLRSITYTPGHDCECMHLLLQPIGDVWYLTIQLVGCTPGGGGAMFHSSWTSDAINSDVNGCPQTGAVTMNLDVDGCSSEVPTVSLST